MEIAILMLSGGLVGALVAWAWGARPPMVSRRVLCQLVSSSDYALRGVLWRARGPWLTLRDAALVYDDGRQQRLDGDVILHRSNLAFVQAYDE